MTKEELKKLPPSAQRKFKAANILRIIVLIFGLVLGGLYGGLAILLGILEGEATAVFIIFNIIGIFAIAGIFQGMIHGISALISRTRRKIESKDASLVGNVLNFIVMAIMLEGYIVGGFVFAIIDLFRLILRKPLVYKSELESIMLSKKVQNEIYYLQHSPAHNNAVQADDPLWELEQMLNEGLITEEDYNQKKQALMKRKK